MNGTFHLIRKGGNEIWIDGEDIERLTKYDTGEDTSRFYVEIIRKMGKLGMVVPSENILDVAFVEFYPNTKEKEQIQCVSKEDIMIDKLRIIK